jgi:glucose/arabinose dehydrogenase
MSYKLVLSFAISLLIASNISAQFTLENAFPNLSFNDPLDLQNSGDGTNRIFVVERAGIIKVFPNSSSVTSLKTYLNITDRVSSGGEMGLLGLAFHPDYENNGYFYVNYTVSNPRKTRISRFQVSSENPDSADKNTELILLTFDQPYSNHNGGWIGFGPDDGYLYIGTGDGGSGGDPLNNGQSIITFLGKILRIDIDNQDPGLEYAIPSSNPFVDSTGSVVKEIYAWGLRNPWRCSFDPVTGWLWCADVGQNQWEEIDIIENGKNYGWRCYEGNHPYNTNGCNYPEYIYPIWEYSHSFGCSVTGGYVYRGPSVPELTGKYIYADYCSSTIWSLEYDGLTPPDNQTLLTAPGLITSFGLAENNELYVITFSPDKIYRFSPTAAIIAPTGLDGFAGITLGIPPQVIVDLSWNDNSNNEAGFIIERKTYNGNFQAIDSVESNVTIYTDWTVVDTTTYTYRVYAFNAANNSGYSNEFTVTTPLRTIEAPINLTASATGPNEVYLNWTDNTLLEEGYKIERKTGIQGSYSVIDSLGKNSESYTDQSVVQNTLYYYRVFAFLEQIVSDYSNEDSAQTPNPTGVRDSRIPDEYKLEQNYPNPFNPSTKINFSLAETSTVNIRIYNSLGKTIDIVSSGIMPAGFYERTWSAQRYASGIYYLKMTAESINSDNVYSNVIKMIYLK